MLYDLVMAPADSPGQLARIARALGQGGVNIAGLSAFTGRGSSIVHVLVDVPETAERLLANAGIPTLARRATLVVNIPDRPQALAEVMERLAADGINVEQAYLAVGARSATRLVLTVDDVEGGRRALESAS